LENRELPKNMIDEVSNIIDQHMNQWAIILLTLLTFLSAFYLDFMKEKLYGPYLVYFMKNRLLGFAIPIAMLILTFGAIKGGIIKLKLPK
jgi:hypothetical protein